MGSYVVVRKFGLGEDEEVDVVGVSIGQKGPPFEVGEAIDVEEEDARESRCWGWEGRRP